MRNARLSWNTSSRLGANELHHRLYLAHSASSGAAACAQTLHSASRLPGSLMPGDAHARKSPTDRKRTMLSTREFTPSAAICIQGQGGSRSGGMARTTYALFLCIKTMILQWLPRSRGHRTWDIGTLWKCCFRSHITPVQ